MVDKTKKWKKRLQRKRLGYNCGILLRLDYRLLDLNLKDRGLKTGSSKTDFLPQVYFSFA